MKILIADDNLVERLILAKVLEKEGHQVIQAETGKQALELYQSDPPSLVFLDVLMPELDGYEVAEAIKGMQEQRWVPIIFLTSLTDAYDLAKCIESGGDDFVSKPINQIIIQAKVDAFSRISNLYETIEQQKSEIEYHNEHLIQEQEAAKKVFNNIAHRGCLSARNINYHLSPMSIFNGDLMLAAETPMGGLRLMLADFTGHGLPAAIGAMPTSEIFYSMTKKGFTISDVMTEMNARLHLVLPRGIFCCVIIADIDAQDERICIWNAGAPQAYIIDQEKEEITFVHSSHLPLGIQAAENFKIAPVIYPFSPKHKLLAVTDGIIESMNSDSVMYGEQRLAEFIQQNVRHNNLCQGLVDDAIAFSGNSDQADDLSLLEVGFPTQHLLDDDPGEKSAAAHTGTLDSKISLCLRGKSLGRFDPIPLLLQTLLECRELLPHRTRIFTILSELYNNALEHGVLELDSDTKNDSAGFARYYQERNQGLLALESGFVRVEVDHKPLENGGEIVFDFYDSGQGFDFERLPLQQNQKYSGRGIPLIINLCETVEFFELGSHVRAIYRWTSEPGTED